MIRACISIAVSRPEGGLDALPGALEASRAVIGWAAAAKFDIMEAVTDERAGSSVTVAVLKKLFKDAISSPQDVIEHLVVHFAGHGFADEIYDQFLLLSNWHSDPSEAINVRRFVRLLQYYQPGRVSLLFDACRSDKPREAAEVQGSGILDRPPESPKEFLEDRFRPATAGKESYMIRDLAGGPSQCLFSAVLVKALCGGYQEAVETRCTGQVVTSATLYRAIKTHLRDTAKRYRLPAIEESLHPGFVAPDDVYTWLPVAFTPPELPVAARSLAEAEQTSRARKEEALISAYKSEYAQEQHPKHYETGCGLVVSGDLVRVAPIATPPLWVEPDRPLGRESWWRVHAPSDWNPLDLPASLVVELASGVCAGAAVIPAMITAISIKAEADHRGAASIIFRPVEGRVPYGEPEEVSDLSETVVAKLRAGALTPATVLATALRIRHMKHVNPMLGAISAYLYDAVGDRDSIRRVAWFYTQHLQPIPFDVALLADLKGERGADGRLRVDLPVIQKREPRTLEEEQHPDYFHETTAQEKALVAGGFPWLRQGWDLLDLVQLPVHPGVTALSRHVLPMPFTTLEKEAGMTLARLVSSGEV